MSEQIEKQILIRYEPIKKIGSGAYGHVWKVVDRRKKTIHALKKNFDAFQNSTDAQRTYRQIMFLQQFRHPNIIQLQDIHKADNDKDIYLLFEYMDIDLYTLIRQNILGDRHKRFIVYQIAKALQYLHSGDLIHRDIKPSNILVNENCLAKVCDFGLVRSVNNDQLEEQPILTEYIATRWYRAPEILLGSKKYTKAVDVWSFGCLLGEILRGKPLFPGNSTLNQIERAITWSGPPSLSDMKSLKTQFGREMLDLLSKIKQINRKDWIPNCPEDAMDLLQKTLQFNPEKRPTMREILKHPYMKQFYKESQIVQPSSKIKIFINDNLKLTLKDYRNLIYKQIKQKIVQSGTPSPITSIQAQSQLRNHSAIHKTRMKKSMVRSASKQRQGSQPASNVKDSRTVSLKKKYDSLMGKKQEFIKTKYIKTQQKEGSHSKNKNNQNLSKFFWDKKKKSTSNYEPKKNSQAIGKYMYKNRYY